MRPLVAVPEHAQPVRVLVVEEHPVIRIGLLSVLNAERDMAVVGAAGDLTDALVMIERWAPDTVLLDPELKSVDGPTAVRFLLEHAPGLHIVALGQHDGDEAIYRVLEAGACGYLFKTSAVSEIVAALRDARAGRTCVSPHARQRLEERRRQPDLTIREREVLALLAEGRCNATIAAVLEITHGTVKLHVRSILAKLGVEDRAQAALVALRRGFARMPADH
ncbi:MAG: two component transcriptional regulator, LuxR family [Myxococcales bacterium]|jgi:two-component system NarL family response regulator|nr:two component transcriptional regulator, LuxR family [Myxococcales bacterium]